MRIRNVTTRWVTRQTENVERPDFTRSGEPLRDAGVFGAVLRGAGRLATIVHNGIFLPARVARRHIRATGNDAHQDWNLGQTVAPDT